MKILFCSNKYLEVTNGPAKFANLLLQINEDYPDHEIKILTEDVIDETSAVVKVHVGYPRFLKLFSQFFRMYYYHRAVLRIRREGFDADVVVYNNAFVGLLTAIFLKNTVGMVNDYSNASLGIKNFSFKYTFIKRYIFKQFEHLSIFYFSKVIANSNYLIQILEKSYPCVKGKVFKLNKAIEPAKKVSSKNILTDQQIDILFVKADYKLGGLENLVEALEMLDFRFKLIVVGPTPSAKKVISNWIKTEERIELDFRGPLRQKEVFALMESSHILCIPSHKEAFGVANLEALIRGLAVVSTNVGGIPEVLRGGKNGWMVPANDSKALAEALHECITKPSLREAKREQGRAYATNFLPEKIIPQFLQILAKN